MRFFLSVLQTSICCSCANIDSSSKKTILLTKAFWKLYPTPKVLLSWLQVSQCSELRSEIPIYIRWTSKRVWKKAFIFQETKECLVLKKKKHFIFMFGPRWSKCMVQRFFLSWPQIQKKYSSLHFESQNSGLKSSWNWPTKKHLNLKTSEMETQKQQVNTRQICCWAWLSYYS